MSAYMVNKRMNLFIGEASVEHNFQTTKYKVGDKHYFQTVFRKNNHKTVVKNMLDK